MGQTYDTILTEKDFTTANRQLDNDDFLDVWKYKVPAGQIIAFGSGKIVLGVDTRGLLKLFLQKAAAAQITPYVTRLILRDANGLNTTVITEFKDDLVDTQNSGVGGARLGVGGKTGNEKNIPSVSQDQYLVLQVKSLEGTASLVVSGTTKITVPVTINAIK